MQNNDDTKYTRYQEAKIRELKTSIRKWKVLFWCLVPFLTAVYLYGLYNHYQANVVLETEVREANQLISRLHLDKDLLLSKLSEYEKSEYEEKPSNKYIESTVSH